MVQMLFGMERKGKMSKDTMNGSTTNENTNDKPAMLDLIQKSPHVLGGEACIGKRRIAVWMLVRARQLGLTDEQIKTDYLPPLSEAELAAAWRYYEQNREEIDRAIHFNEDD
jgi:uncharacterized protein (DUF433 family)